MPDVPSVHFGGGSATQLSLAPDVPSWPAGQPCKPSFMVIGAPKSGSTSLFSYLQAHPQVHQPARKELCYFSDFKRHLTNYRSPTATSWPNYVAAFSGHAALQHSIRQTRRGRRSKGEGKGEGKGAGKGEGKNESKGRRWWHGRRLSSGGHPNVPGSAQCEELGKLAFEGCPFYLGEHRAAVRLHAVFPSLRVIAILRNPRERTVSGRHTRRSPVMTSSLKPHLISTPIPL